MFRCRQCRDILCSNCRAPAERDLCSSCQVYFRDQAEAELRGPIDEFAEVRKQRRRPLARYVVAALVVVDLALVVLWLVVANPFGVNEFEKSIDVVATVARTVEDNRGADGKVVPSLLAIADRLPASVAEMIRRGEVIYAPSEDRVDFEVSLMLGSPGF